MRARASRMTAWRGSSCGSQVFWAIATSGRVAKAAGGRVASEVTLAQIMVSLVVKIATRAGTAALAVQLQRKHGQRMPVPRRRRSKGAHGRPQVQSDLDIRVSRDVQVVIEINESILPYRIINAEREQDQEQGGQV